MAVTSEKIKQFKDKVEQREGAFSLGGVENGPVRARFGVSFHVSVPSMPCWIGF